MATESDHTRSGNYKQGTFSRVYLPCILQHSEQKGASERHCNDQVFLGKFLPNSFAMM